MLSFTSGGWGMYPTCALGVILFYQTLRLAARMDRRRLPGLAVLAASVLFAGAAGFITGVIRSTERAEDARLLWLGIGESLHNLALAALLLFFSGVTLSIALWRDCSGSRTGSPGV